MRKNKNNEESTKNQKNNPEVENLEQAELQSEESTEQEAEKIVDEFELMSQKCAELNDKNLRLMAEFDNYRKRTLKERSELYKTAGEGLLVNMLPLVDDFERALKAIETADDVIAVKEGVELIYTKFIAFLLQSGVKSIPTENELFNTDVHEAITTFPAPTEELKGKIIECVSKGYTLNEKVIRFSKVVVGE